MSEYHSKRPFHLTSERDLKILEEEENAVLIGNGVDEPIRHHLMLKSVAFRLLKSTYRTVEYLGKAFEGEGSG